VVREGLLRGSGRVAGQQSPAAGRGKRAAAGGWPRAPERPWRGLKPAPAAAVCPASRVLELGFLLPPHPRSPPRGPFAGQLRHLGPGSRAPRRVKTQRVSPWQPSALPNPFPVTASAMRGCPVPRRQAARAICPCHLGDSPALPAGIVR